MQGKITRREFGMGLIAFGLMATTVSALEQKALAGVPATQNAPTAPPASSFRITYLPYRRPGHEEMPVRVFNVIGQSLKEPLTRQFSMKNMSSKAVQKIKISMYVSYDKHAYMPVLHSVHSSYVFASPLKPQAEQVFQGEDKLKDLFGPLLVDGHLNGNYRVEVLVSEVKFEDGSTWKLPEMAHASAKLGA
jgi:hypothetical protein